MNQPQEVFDFDGVTYVPARDGVRLGGQMRRVFDVMADGRWRTLSQIARDSKGSEAGVSARLRDLRKPKFGSYSVDSAYVEKGVWKYRLNLEKNQSCEVEYV